MASLNDVSRDDIGQAVQDLFSAIAVDGVITDVEAAGAEASLFQAFLGQGMDAASARTLAQHLRAMMSFAVRQSKELDIDPAVLLARMVEEDAVVQKVAASLERAASGPGVTDSIGSSPGNANAQTARTTSGGDAAQGPVFVAPNAFAAGDSIAKLVAEDARAFAVMPGTEVLGMLASAAGARSAQSHAAPEITSLTGDPVSPHLATFIPPEIALLTVEGSVLQYSAGVEPRIDAPVSAPNFAAPPPANMRSEVSIAAPVTTVLEGTSGQTTLVSFVVTRTNPAAPGTVSWSGSGLDASMFPGGVLPSGSVSFAPGQTRATITIEMLGNVASEADRQFTVTLTSADPVQHVVGSTANINVVDDDAMVSVTALQTSVLEGNAGSQQVLRFAVTRTSAVDVASTDWTLSGLDAADFGGTVPSGSVVFAAGETSKIVEIVLTGDDALELDETLTLTLVPRNNLMVAASGASASTVVRNDDSFVSVSLPSASFVEGPAGASTTLTFTVSRTGGEHADSIAWSASGLDPAWFGGTLPSGLVEFGVGELTRTITITIPGNKSIDGDRTLTVSLEPTATTRLAPGAGSTNIVVLEDDGIVSIGAAQPMVLEGTTGETRALTFTVTRTNGVAAGSVDWAASGVDAALFGGTLPSGTIHFAAGETSRVITLTAASGDLLIDASETLTLTLSNPGDNLILSAQPSAQIEIRDDDGTISIAPESGSVPEGDSGATQMLRFVVTRTNGLGASTVDWAASGMNPAHFGGTLPSGTVVFAAGESSKVIEIPMTGDRIETTNATLTVTLSNLGPNLLPGTLSTSMTIVNDDAAFSVSADHASVAEGDIGNTQAVTFTVSRTNAVSASSVDWTVGGDVDAADFGGTLPSGTVSFAPGELTRQVTVTLTGDRTIEAVENLTLTLSNPGANASIDTATATTAITNDDLGFSLTALNTRVLEGAQGQQTAVTFVVSRSDNLNQPMNIDYRLFSYGDNGVDAQDFVGGQDALGNNGGLPSGTVSFGANETSKIVTIYVAGDGAIEFTEDFGVLLANPPMGTQIIGADAYGHIANDDQVFSIAAVAASTFEGNGAGGIQQFLITRQGDISQAASIGYTSGPYGEIPLSADDFADGVWPSGIASFAPGQSSVLISVELMGDSALEGFETWEMSLVSAPNTSIVTSVARVTTAPDDMEITIAAVDATVKEGTSAPASHTFVVTRSQYLDAPVDIAWSVTGSGGNPANAADFGGTLPSGTIHFAAGETTKTITLTPSPDGVLEPSEGYTVALTSSATGVVITTPTASGTILNDDVGLSILNLVLDRYEGNPNAPATLTFRVNRSGDTTQTGSVNWALEPNSIDGVDAADFGGTLPSGTLNFARGVSTLLVTIPIATDTVIEADEGFTVRLSSPSAGSQILVGEASGQLRNDDAILNLVAHADVAEGSNGTRQLLITVERSGDTRTTHTVDFAITAGSIGTSVSAADFAGGAFPSGTLTFAAGETSKTIAVDLVADSVLEADESFTVTLSNPGAGVVLANSTHTIVVTNDDDEVAISADAASANEGVGGATTAMTFTVTRTGDTTKSTTLDWQVVGSGGSPATAADFAGGVLPSGSITFAAGETTRTITVQVAGDDTLEPTEGYTLQLSNAPAGTVITTAAAPVQITNDDTALAISATATNILEGGAGTKTHEFTIVRSGITSGTTSVDWTVAGTGASPVPSSDFQATSGTVVFAPGETVKTISIVIAGDTLVEDDQEFTVTLGNAGNTDLIVPSAVGRVLTDDHGFSVAAQSASLVEGTSGSTQSMQFVVTRSGDTTVSTSVDWTASGMSADDFSNGTALNGTVTFAPGETTQIITLPLRGDKDVESDETLTITLSNPSAPGQLVQATASTLVTDDDAALSIADASVTEGAAATTTDITFTVTRTGNLAGTSTTDWVLQLPGGAGSAALDDFAPGQDVLGTNNGLPSGSVTFAPGETTATVTVTVAGDGRVELDEAFTIALQNSGANTFISATPATGTIGNDDLGFSVARLDIPANEGDGGTATYRFVVTRAGDTASAALVDWSVGGNAGVNGATGAASASDFDGGVFPNGTLSFAAGETSKIIDVLVDQDGAMEADEGFSVTLTNARLADTTPQNIVDATADAVIVNDDVAFSAVAVEASVAEGSSGSRSIVFNVQRTGDLTGTQTIDYAVTGSNGATAADVVGGVLPSGQLTFGPGVAQLSVTVNVVTDTVAEGDETFTLTISNPSDGSISTATADTVVQKRRYQLLDHRTGRPAGRRERHEHVHVHRDALRRFVAGRFRAVARDARHRSYDRGFRRRPRRARYEQRHAERHGQLQRGPIHAHDRRDRQRRYDDRIRRSPGRRALHADQRHADGRSVERSKHAAQR